MGTRRVYEANHFSSGLKLTESGASETANYELTKAAEMFAAIFFSVLCLV
jgi:hypothetical protein